jgi:CheY-like chemotaxis protein
MDTDKKKILVAEDEKPMANALKLKLESEGYQVVLAFNGKEAIEALESEKFDLLLLDLVMPEKTGFDVLEEIKSKNLSIPVIVLSNLAQEEDIGKAKKFGVINYFVKSNTSLSEISEHIKKII